VKFKLVPAAPDDVAFVDRARRAVPLVPGTEADCCARLMDRLDLPSRDVARTWLTFLRALELAEETPSGFRRTGVEPTVRHCRVALLDRVFAAAAVRDALEAADDGATVDDAFGAVRDAVPVWERHKNPSRWEAVWRERVGDLLDWLVLLDAAERIEGEPVRYAPR
jgi:hypothetical protein